MTHHVLPRQTSNTFAEFVLEEYLPSDCSGYVRPLTQADAHHEYYIEGGFGFFASDGEWLGSSPGFDSTVALAWNEGFLPYRVH